MFVHGEMGRFPAPEIPGNSMSTTQKPLDLLGKSRLQWNLHLLLEKDFIFKCIFCRVQYEKS